MKIGDYVEFHAPGPNGKKGRGWVASFQGNGILRIRLKGGKSYRHCPEDYCRVLPERIIRQAYPDD